MEWGSLELEWSLWEGNRHEEKSEEALTIQEFYILKVTLKEEMEEQWIKRATYHPEK